MVLRQSSSSPHWSHSMAGQLGYVPNPQGGLVNSLSCSEEPAHCKAVAPLGLQGKKMKSKAIC